MKKIIVCWKAIGAILLIAVFIVCFTGAVQVDVSSTVPELPAQSLESVTTFMYHGYSADELGIPETMAAQLASYSETDIQLYMTAYLLAKWDAESSGQVFVPEQSAKAIESNRLMLTDGSLDAESIRIRKLKADCIMQTQGKSETEIAALWEAFDAQAGGFDSVAAYRAWKAEWEASITPTETEIAAWESQDKQNEQMRRESNGTYMGCDPNGP